MRRRSEVVEGAAQVAALKLGSSPSSDEGFMRLGNQTSVAAINELKESVRGGLSKAGLITLPDPIPIGAVEQSSALTPTLQAGDLAAGYAEDLYRSSEGIRRVCEEFKGVILNGSMVRDWKQIERTDLDRLR